MRPLRSGLLAAAALALAAQPEAGARPEPPAAGRALVTWADVGPIFERACVHCHGGPLAVEGLSLSTAADARKGARSGPVLVAGDPSGSTLISRLRGKLTPGMPLDGDPLPEAEIARVEAWIRDGALPAPASPADERSPGEPVPPPASPGAPPPPGPDAGAPPPEPAPLRWRDVAPVLRANCVRCHQPKGVQGPAPEGLRFDTLEALRSGERASVLPGAPELSPLIRAVRGLSDKRMPLGGPPWLADADVERLTRWVRDGARDDNGRPSPVPVGRRVRLTGVLDGQGRIDGLPADRGQDARVDDRLAPGQRARGRYVVGADGRLVLERLERR